MGNSNLSKSKQSKWPKLPNLGVLRWIATIWKFLGQKRSILALTAIKYPQHGFLGQKLGQKHRNHVYVFRDIWKSTWNFYTR